MNPLLPLSRHGVRWGIWRRGVLRTATADMHGDATERRRSGQIQRGHTADRLFGAVMLVQRGRLSYAQLSSALTTNMQVAERNALLTDVALSLLLPAWEQRGAWFADGVKQVSSYPLHLGTAEWLRVQVEMTARDDMPQYGVSPVAWPTPHTRARITVSPPPTGWIHCTLEWRD
jgi:hypothetical protein